VTPFLALWLHTNGTNLVVWRADDFGGRSIPRTIADAAVKLGRDRNDFSVERITPEQYRTLAQLLSS
jgi:hypothetical protein